MLAMSKTRNNLALRSGILPLKTSALLAPATNDCPAGKSAAKLHRFARNNNLDAAGATKRPDGQITKICPAAFEKIFRFHRRATQ